MDGSRSLTRKEPVAVLVYRTRVPVHLWPNLDERALLIDAPARHAVRPPDARSYRASPPAELLLVAPM